MHGDEISFDIKVLERSRMSSHCNMQFLGRVSWKLLRLAGAALAVTLLVVSHV